MNKTFVFDLYNKIDKFSEKDVTVSGWIRSLRASKSFGFIELYDGSIFKSVQVVFEDDLEDFAKISKLNVGSSIEVIGTVKETPEAKQPFEIKAKSISITGASTPEYPLQKKRHSFEYLRTIAHLRPRTNTFSAVFRIRSIAAFAIHRFFSENGFIYVHTPIITGSDAEGAGEMFRVTTLDIEKIKGEVDYKDDFFGKSTTLTVSGQLQGEAMAQAFGKIYTFGPTFRAENSNTPRHAAEFWMIEPEIAFADLNDDMALAEAMLKYVIKYVLENAKADIEFLNSFVDKDLLQRLESLVSSDFDHMTYTDAISVLEKVKDKFQYPVFWGADLQTEHERFLTEEVCKKPVFITDYPKEIKAFYMRQNEDNKTVAAMDLLVPGVGELIGGSQREERYEVLKSRMEELSMNTLEYDWYLDLRKYGSTHHAGFGLGFERLIMYITGMSNIRDVLPFPRTVGSADF